MTQFQDGELVRSRTAPPIYVLIRGRRRHIPDSASFRFLQFDPRKVHYLSQSELDVIPIGSPLPSFEAREELQVSRPDSVGQATPISLETQSIKLSSATLAATIITATLLILIAILLPHYVPYSAGLKSAERESAVASFRMALVQIFATIAVITGLYFTSQTLFLGRQNLEVLRSNQVAERFGASLELASIEKIPDLRLGGILALRRIGMTSPYVNDKVTISLFLCSLLRLDSSSEKKRTISEYDAIISTLTDFRKNGHTGFYDLIHISVSSLHERPINLSHSSLNFATLSKFRSMHSDFSAVSLVEATFIDIDLRYSDLRGIVAREAVFTRCDISWCNLENSVFLRCQLPAISLVSSLFRGAIFIGCDLTSADLRHTDLREATFLDCDFRGYQHDSRTQFSSNIADDEYGNIFV